MSYDKLGRAIKSETPFDTNNTSKTLTYYDNNGNIIKTKEQINAPGSAEKYNITEYEYDSRNRLVCVKVNDGSRDIYTQYAYDNNGNMVKTVTGQTSKISNLYGTLPQEASSNTYEYDRFGNVIKHTDALGNSETTVYNLMGLPVANIDRKGNVTTNTYNAYGSLLKSTVGTDIITNTYNVNNLMLSSTPTPEPTATPTPEPTATPINEQKMIKLIQEDYGMMCKIMVQNTMNEKVGGQLIIAEYTSDGILSGFCCMSYSGEKDFEAIYQKHNIQSIVKVFLWDSFTNIKPLSVNFD